MTLREISPGARVKLESVLEALGDAKAYFDARDIARAHEELAAGPTSSPLALRLDAEIESLANLLGVSNSP